MYPDWVWVLWGAFFIWLLVLSFLIWKQREFLKSLFPKSGERDIRRKFEENLKEVGDFKEVLSKLEVKLSELKDQGKGYLQRMELIRYNPYEDTGGDQSFTIALLDDKGTGIVVTSLHARSGTRIFAKDVREGKAGKYKFSDEEEKIVKKAMIKV